MGRFLQTDPLGYQDSMNLYQGMGMNPVNFLDPMGEEIIVEKHFRSKWKRIKRYLTSKSLLAKKIIDYLELPQYKIYIFDVPEEGANSFVEKEKNHILIYDAVTKKKYEGKDVILINSKTGLRNNILELLKRIYLLPPRPPPVSASFVLSLPNNMTNNKIRCSEPLPTTICSGFATIPR